MSHIYSIVTESDFQDAFRRMGRADQFSYAALAALYRHLGEMAEDLGYPIELDIIGLCCEWSEWIGIGELAEAYNVPLGPDEDPDEVEAEIIAEIEEVHTVIPLEGGGWLVGP